MSDAETQYVCVEGDGFECREFILYGPFDYAAAQSFRDRHDATIRLIVRMKPPSALDGVNDDGDD